MLGNFGEQREDIFVSRADGSELCRLTDDVARDRAPRWSPDGHELAFYQPKRMRSDLDDQMRREPTDAAV